MGRCCESQEVERFLTGSLSVRRSAALHRHMVECKKCAEAIAQAEANESWLSELRDAREVADLRERLRSSNTLPPAPMTEG